MAAGESERLKLASISIYSYGRLTSIDRIFSVAKVDPKEPSYPVQLRLDLQN
jgi:hypothetical protein